jgi:molybdopterin converting factor small subunit
LRDQIGCAALTIPFPTDGTQASFWRALGEKLPGVLPKNIRLARDDEFLAAAAPLRPGDELALSPPVSGG